MKNSVGVQQVEQAVPRPRTERRRRLKRKSMVRIGGHNAGTLSHAEVAPYGGLGCGRCHYS